MVCYVFPKRRRDVGRRLGIIPEIYRRSLDAETAVGVLPADARAMLDETAVAFKSGNISGAIEASASVSDIAAFSIIFRNFIAFSRVHIILSHPLP